MSNTTPREEILVIVDTDGPTVTTVSTGDVTTDELKRAARGFWTLGDLEWLETEETAPDEFVSVFAPYITEPCS